MIHFKVEDMTCNHCVMTVTKAVKALDGAARIDIDLPAHSVKIESGKSASEVEAVIRDAGFTPVVAA